MATVPEYGLFIGGQNVKTADRYEVRNPYDNQLSGYVDRAGEAEIESAIASGSQAFTATRCLSRAERAEMLAAMSRAVTERRTELESAITLCTGKPISYSRAEVGRTAGVLALAAEEAKRFGGRFEPLDFDPARRGAVGIVERFPLGLITAIAPFNFPLNLVTHKVAPALAAGNSVIVKPPPQCPGPALALAEIAAACGAPSGAVNVISAEPPLAERLALDDRVRMISFTGSARVGWSLKSKARRQRVTLELGGNGGLIVDDSADLDFAARRAAYGAFVHAGQVCISVQRIFVHRSVYKGFLRRFVNETERLTVGDPTDERTIVGPMVNRAAADRVMEWIAEAKAAGAGILTGNLQEDTVVRPTIIELANPALRRLRVWCEEIFGPVATVEAVESFDEAVRAVNDSPYGLQAGVFTANLQHAFEAFRAIEAGAVIVNETGVFRVDSYPFGGTKESGVGREGVRYAMEEMSEPRMLALNFTSR